MPFNGANSRVFPEVCGSWIWKPDNGDILPGILCRFRARVSKSVFSGTAVSIAHATGTAACAFDRAANSVTPDRTKMSWVATPTVMSTTMDLRARNAPPMDEPGAGDVAAHSGDWQERVDGFPDPAHPDNAEDVGPARGRQQLPPRLRVKRQRDETIERYRQQPPAELQHGARHLCGPAVDDQDDDNQEAANPSDDQQLRNDMAPVSARARAQASRNTVAAPSRL